MDDKTIENKLSEINAKVNKLLDNKTSLYNDISEIKGEIKKIERLLNSLLKILSCNQR